MYEQNTFIEWEGQLPWEKERKKNLGFISSTFLLQFGKVIHSDGVFLHLQNKVAAAIIPLMSHLSGGSRMEMVTDLHEFQVL